MGALEAAPMRWTRASRMRMMTGITLAIREMSVLFCPQRQLHRSIRTDEDDKMTSSSVIREKSMSITFFQSFQFRLRV